MTTTKQVIVENGEGREVNPHTGGILINSLIVEKLIELDRLI